MSVNDDQTVPPGPVDPLRNPEELKTPPAPESPQTPSATGEPSLPPTPQEPQPSPPLKEPSTSPDPEQSGGEPLDPQRQQRVHRPENQDFVRVLNMFGSELPQVYYIDHIQVEKDMVMGLRGAASADVYPPPYRESAVVSPIEIRKIRQVYQRHAAYPKALKILNETRAVVLRGQPHIGKRSAAIFMAYEMGFSEVTLHELSPEDNLVGQIKALEHKPGTVYLVDGLLRERGRELTSLAARNILDILAKQNCALVICARLDVPLPAELRSVLMEPPALSARLLVEAHLPFYGSFSKEDVKHALDHPQVAEVLKTPLTPAQADQLAKQIAESLEVGASMEQALGGFAAAVEDEVHKWLDETADDVEDSAFRITLSVFSGVGYDDINAAAKELARTLLPELEAGQNNKEEKGQPISPLKKARRKERLGEARAKSVRRMVTTDYSDHALVEVIELENPNYTRALLTYLWTEIGEWRQPLLDWLCDYAVNAHLALRMRAAGALGLLAAIDFNSLNVRVFRPWAFTGGDDPARRRRHYQAIGNALGVLIWNDERAEDVLGLLRAWVDDGRRALKWAAARAYAQVGLRYPREALYQWRRILESQDRVHIRLTETFGIAIPHPLHESVMDAILSLFLRAVELPHRLRMVFEPSLEGIAAWVEADEKEPDSQKYGLPIFLLLTAIRIPPDEGNGEVEDWPPAMLHIVGTQPDSSYRRTLAGLLRRALNHPDWSQMAQEALEMWLECAQENRWLEGVLTALLKEMLALPTTPQSLMRESGRLLVFLQRKAKHPKHPLNVAQSLIKNLNLDRDKPMIHSLT